MSDATTTRATGTVHWYAHPKPGDPAKMTRWCGEYWPDEDEDTGHPWAVCWVSEYPPLSDGKPFVMMLFVLVDDDHRNEGFCRPLIRSARRRWPGLRLTGRRHRDN